jgi:aryl-alcohol dehydrogenase-like predicted oxidoreductase
MYACIITHKIVFYTLQVRHFGLSNETPYGATSFLLTAEMLGLSHLRPVTVQNAYNLLERNDFESGMLETCSPRNGNIGLLAYSPLAGGALTGKYLNLAGGGSAPDKREV